MNIFGVLLLIGAVALCGYLTYTLVKDIRAIKKRKKGDKEE